MKKTIAALLSIVLILSVCPFVSAAGYSVICEPQYNMAESFENSVTKVSKDSKWALADTTGKAITAFSWDAIGDTVSDYIPAKRGELWGYISTTGKTLIPFEFTQAGCFKDGIALVKTLEGDYAFINTSGSILFKSPFSYSFSPSGGAICGSIDGLYGFCDTMGEIIISPKFEMAYDFSEGYAAVRVDGKWGYINTDGSYHIKPTYDYAGSFINGFAVCITSGKYGIINKKGVKTSASNFDYIASPDENGRFPAKRGVISGYINSNGEWLMQTDYDYCYRFTNGVARVYKDGLWGYIDEAGNEIVSPLFTDCGEYHKDRAAYSLDGMLWGYLTLDLTVDAPPAPQNPAVTPEPETPNESGIVIQNPAIIGDLPLAPDSTKCISMKIGSNAVITGSGESVLSACPVLLEGTTMVPVRDVVELMGGTVEWFPETKRIYISYKYKNISLILGSKICFVNGTPTPLTKAPQLIGSSTMIPLRNIVDNLSCELKWVDSSQNIFIYY